MYVAYSGLGDENASPFVSSGAGLVTKIRLGSEKVQPILPAFIQHL